MCEVKRQTRALKFLLDAHERKIVEYLAMDDHDEIKYNQLFQGQ